MRPVARGCVPLLAVMILFSTVPAGRTDPIMDPMMLGFNCNLAYDYRQLGFSWKVEGKAVDLMRFMSLNGSSWVRFGITTNATGSSSLSMALQTIGWAHESALMADVFFYLSSIGADLGKQPAPIGWEGKSVAERASLAREHVRSCVTALLNANASDHFYEVGNEVDYGVCGSFVSDQSKWAETQSNIESLKTGVWADEAIILREAIAGLREADPNATVALHLSHWWNLTFSLEFFDFMKSSGVAFDIAGMSYYPSSGIYDLGEFLGPAHKVDADTSAIMFRRTVTGLADSGYRVMICEFAYPCTPNIPEPFSYFDKQLSDYPLSPEGQAKFIEDTLLWLYSQQNVAGALYFAPQFYETYLTNVWGAFAWFDESGEARPAAFSIGEVVSLQSGLVAQRDARVAIITAWDAIDKAQSDLRTDGLQTAQSKVQQAWSSYRAGTFAVATQLANEAAEAASEATNPTIRTIFIVLVVGAGIAALLAIAILVLKVMPMFQKRQPPPPPLI
jgi:arabinogalactan endo-1,4-beta-galactosidase